ncbi:hypothetical protein [Nocardia amamiensis]|uniref:hypothetical protein n=1 Tax=Nocardia amamiensis TaxID=404578 RepID=UPI0033CEFFE2
MGEGTGEGVVRSEVEGAFEAVFEGAFAAALEGTGAFADEDDLIVEVAGVSAGVVADMVEFVVEGVVEVAFEEVGDGQCVSEGASEFEGPGEGVIAGTIAGADAVEGVAEVADEDDVSVVFEVVGGVEGTFDVVGEIVGEVAGAGEPNGVGEGVLEETGLGTAKSADAVEDDREIAGIVATDDGVAVCLVEGTLDLVGEVVNRGEFGFAEVETPLGEDLDVVEFGEGKLGAQCQAFVWGSFGQTPAVARQRCHTTGEDTMGGSTPGLREWRFGSGCRQPGLGFSP